jgi:hypothetical protein
MKHAALFGVVFAVCYGGASWVTAQHASLPAWDLPFEQHVPFVPVLSVIYLTITPALLLALYRTRGALGPALCAETLLATLCFLLFPQTVAWTRPAVTGWAHVPFSIADALNLSYNQFPSLHVAFAVSVAWALQKPLWWIWSAAVAASAWLMWEHHLIDILGGAALAAIVMPLFWPRVHVELLCLRQCAHFSLRHVRYFVIFLAIWLPSLLHWRRYRAVRTGFCAAQWIDDLLDGHRSSRREPLEIADDLLARRFGDDGLSRLVLALFEDLDAAGQSEFMELVRCMRTDRLRVLHRERWTQARLDTHHEATFRHSVNLMLRTTGCTARASGVPSLLRALAWCSVIRDLDDDRRHGLDNIPRDTDPTRWLSEQHTHARTALTRSAEEITRLDDPRARRILRIFQRSVEKYARNSPARVSLAE